MKLILLAAIALLLDGCSWSPMLKPPTSLGEQSTGFTYIPLDPLPVETRPGLFCKFEQVDLSKPWLGSRLSKDVKLKAILDSLPDNAVRMAIREFNSKGKISIGTSSVGSEGHHYQVILDYVNSDSTNIRFLIKTTLEGTKVVQRVEDPPPYLDDSKIASLTKEELEIRRGNIAIPVYVGVGLRLTADLQVLRGNINLSSLGAIAAGVEAGNASGSLVVQTIGVAGKQISAALPLPSELNQTTLQAAILSLGSIKAVMFDRANTIITPRVTGIYLPLADGTEEQVNLIVSELAREAIPWKRPCLPPDGLE